MAVAAVSRDTMRSFSPPAATPVTVSRYARLLLAVAALTDGACRTAGRHVVGRLRRIICDAPLFPPREHDGGELRKRLLHAVGPLDRPKLAEPRPLVCPEAGRRPVGNGLNGVRATCGQSRGVVGAPTKPDKQPGQ